MTSALFITFHKYNYIYLYTLLYYQAVEELKQDWMGRRDDHSSLLSQCNAIFDEAVHVVKKKLGAKYDYGFHVMLTVESKVVRSRSRYVLVTSIELNNTRVPNTLHNILHNVLPNVLHNIVHKVLRNILQNLGLLHIELRKVLHSILCNVGLLHNVLRNILHNGLCNVLHNIESDYKRFISMLIF